MTSGRTDISSFRNVGQPKSGAAGRKNDRKTNFKTSAFVFAKVTKPCSTSRKTAPRKSPECRDQKSNSSPKTPTKHGRSGPSSIDRVKRCSSPCRSEISNKNNNNTNRNSPFARMNLDFLDTTPTHSTPSPRRRRIIDALQTTDYTPMSPSPESRPHSSSTDPSSNSSSSVSISSRSSSPDVLSLSPTIPKQQPQQQQRQQRLAAPSTTVVTNLTKNRPSHTAAPRSNSRKTRTLASTTGPRATYSGHRSFMSTRDEAFDLSHQSPANHQTTNEGRISKSRSPCHRKGQGNLGDALKRKRAAAAALLQPESSYRVMVDEEDANGSNVVKNVHELRRVGENARFESTIDALFDDLEDETVSIANQRDRLAQMSTCLLDEDVARRFLANALHTRLANCSLRHGDFVSEILRVCVYMSLMTVPMVSSSAFRACAEACLSNDLSLIQLLDGDADLLALLRSPEMEVSESCQKIISELVTAMRTTSRLWGGQAPAIVTPRFLGLRCIELIAQRARETREATISLPDPVLVKLVDIAVRKSRQSHKTKSMDDHTCHTLSLALSTLEAYTAMAVGDLTPTQEAMLRRLSKLGRLSDTLSHLPPSQRGPLQDLQIRLTLNVTNNRPDVCDDFSSKRLLSSLLGIVIQGAEAIAKEDDGDDDDLSGERVPEYVFDSVILALGCLINLTELSEKARTTIFALRSGTALQALVGLYTARRENADKAESVEQTHLNVIYGYLSVLLTTLSLNDDNRSYFRTALSPSVPDRPEQQNSSSEPAAAAAAAAAASCDNGVDVLLSTVEVFLHFYRKVDGDDGDGGDHRPGFARRLEGIVRRLRAVEMEGVSDE